MSRRERLSRVAEGLAELARGNYAHRIIMAGDDEAARMADDINALADRIQREQETTAAADASRRQLLADISHDLRTPITSIAGYVDALQRGLGDEPERYLAVLSQKAGELTQLTDDLFYAARIDAGDLVLKPKPLDLAESVRRSVLGFEPQLVARGIRVDVAVPDSPCVVDADPSAVGRILSNLIGNALRHGEEMTCLGVTLAVTDTAYTVRISNDGARIPADGHALFERGSTGPSGGTGLGLSIARELAERMGGTVSLEAGSCDRPPMPSGVTFALTLPRTAS